MNQNYHKKVKVNATPKQVFEAVTKSINEWWSENFQGRAEKEGDEFTARFGATFKTMRITFVEENRKIIWLCIDQHIETPPGIAPLNNKQEWVGNNIVWEIEEEATGSIIKHTHIGLTPDVECWGVCETGWDQTLKSLASLLDTGTGMPFEQLDEEHMERALEHQRLKA